MRSIAKQINLIGSVFRPLALVQVDYTMEVRRVGVADGLVDLWTTTSSLRPEKDLFAVRLVSYREGVWWTHFGVGG